MKGTDNKYIHIKLELKLWCWQKKMKTWLVMFIYYTWLAILIHYAWLTLFIHNAWLAMFIHYAWLEMFIIFNWRQKLLFFLQRFFLLCKKKKFMLKNRLNKQTQKELESLWNWICHLVLYFISKLLSFWCRRNFTSKKIWTFCILYIHAVCKITCKFFQYHSMEAWHN